MSFEDFVKNPRLIIPPSVNLAIEANRQTAITHKLLSGDSLFETLNKAINDLVGLAPKECDVLIEAFGVYVTEVDFFPPHSFLLRGKDQSGNDTFAVAHFSQLVAHVIYLPKKGPERVITGFWRDPKESREASK